MPVRKERKKLKRISPQKKVSLRWKKVNRRWRASKARRKALSRSRKRVKLSNRSCPSNPTTSSLSSSQTSKTIQRGTSLMRTSLREKHRTKVCHRHSPNVGEDQARSR